MKAEIDVSLKKKTDQLSLSLKKLKHFRLKKLIKIFKCNLGIFDYQM